MLLLLIDDDDDIVEADELRRKYEAMFVQVLDLPSVLCEMRSYVDVIFDQSLSESQQLLSQPSLSIDSLGLQADLMLDRLAIGKFWIRLCPLQRFARRVRYLLSRPVANDGKMAGN